MPSNIYRQNLERDRANYAPLTPISLLERSAQVYPEKTAVIHGDRRFTYAEFRERCHRLASALSRRGIGEGDTVAVMAPQCAGHAGGPFRRAHGRCSPQRPQYPARCRQHRLLPRAWRGEAADHRPRICRCHRAGAAADRPNHHGDRYRRSPRRGCGTAAGRDGLRGLHRHGRSLFAPRLLADEWAPISLGYTSGTTGNPKGVVCHHRGAYLNALGVAMTAGLTRQSTYLWTLPMFHCNGWCFTWAVTAVAGTHVCLRRMDPALVYAAIKREGVTHLCGAPVVLNMLANAPDSAKQVFDQSVSVTTGGAAPPSAIIAAMERNGFRVAHAYGLTECYGPGLICAWHDEWDGLSLEERARLTARQGVTYLTLEGVMVADPATLEETPWDGQSMGEIFLRGNTVMMGYLKNPSATDTAFEGGWFHTGDLGVRHPDGYVEVKDRSKDIIISGGENISSLEVEEVLYRHPKVLEAAVVARPDATWGEHPCAFVLPRAEAGDVSVEELIAFCRENMARFKAPRTVVFGPLPKTSTGKIQKYVLRERARSLDPAQS